MRTREPAIAEREDERFVWGYGWIVGNRVRERFVKRIIDERTG